MPSSVPDIVTICGYITAIGAALVLLWKGAKLVIGLVRKINNFLDDWNGEPERPGVPARPGVMTRLDTMEAELSRTGDELKTNHGSSLRDAVNRVEKTVDLVQKQLNEHLTTQSDK